MKRLELLQRVPLRALSGIAAVLPWCLLEVLLWRSTTAETVALAVALSVDVGALLGLVALPLRHSRWLAALLMLPLPLIHALEISWAIGRVFELRPGLATWAIWVGALGVASGLGYLVFRLVRRRWPDRRQWRWFAAGAGFVLVVALLVPEARGAPRPIAGVFGHLALLGVLGVCVWGWGRHVLCPGVALVCGAALTLLPDNYTGLQAALGGLTVGATLVSVEAWWTRLRPDAEPARATWRVAGVLVVLFLAGGALADWLMARVDTAWRSKGGRSGVTTFLVRLGHTVTDVDRDGYGLVFGQRDCRPFDSGIHPGRHEISKNGIDDNCLLGDATGEARAWFIERDAMHEPPRGRNGDLVVVLVDTLRYDDATELELPAIREMLAESVQFDRMYSTATFTPLALMGILAGRLPTNLELVWQGPFNGCPARPPGGLAPRLRAAGFDTALVGGADRDQNDCFQPTTFGEGFRLLELTEYFATAEEVTERAVATWQRLDAEKRRFLYVHYLSVHNGGAARDTYRQALTRFDRAFSTLRQAIGKDAVWVLASDHGQEFYERGHLGHSRTLYEEVVHVPLAIAAPSLRPRRVVTVSSLRSLYPTLMAMLVPSVVPAGKGPYLCVDQSACVDQPAPMAVELQTTHLHGLVIGRHKIVRDLELGSVAAYDLMHDPEERSPLLRVPADLRSELEAWEEHGLAATGDAHVWPYDRAD